MDKKTREVKKVVGESHVRGLTRSSLVAANLYNAASNPICMDAIVRKAFEEAKKSMKKKAFSVGTSRTMNDEVRAQRDIVESEDEPDFDLDGIAYALLEDRLDNRRMDYLKRGFSKICRALDTPP